MKKTIVIYALILAAAAFFLEWLEYRYVAKAFSTEIYILLLVTAFTAMGIWMGSRLTRRRKADNFILNEAAFKSLGLTAREYTVLELMASGQSNKEIARSLGVSPNTVKTHIANLFEKLEVRRRVDAINKARDLTLIP